MCPYVYDLYLQELQVKKAAQAAKPQINPAIVKAYSDADKLVNDRLRLLAIPLLKKIMTEFHDMAEVHHQVDKSGTGHQVNSIAANKIAILIQEVKGA